MNTVSIDLPREGWEWNAEIGAWVSTGGSYDGVSGNPVVIADTAPTDASEGDLWFCTQSGSEALYCFDGQYWFETSSGYDDAQLSQNLTAETQARIAGDSDLQDQIDAFENYDDSDLQNQIDGLVEEAPTSGLVYGRANGDWVAIDPGEGGVGGGGGAGTINLKYDDITPNGGDTYTLAIGGEPRESLGATNLLVSVNGTIQESGEAYTTSGTEITFSENLTSEDVIDFVVELTNGSYWTQEGLNLSYDGPGTKVIADQLQVKDAAQFDADVNVTGNVTAAKFIGDGSELDNLPAGSQWLNNGDDIYYNDGKVGIGTNDPINSFVVSDGSDGIELRTTLSDDNRILSYNRGTSAYTKMSFDAADYAFRINGASQAMTIDAAGNVGIGSSNPADIGGGADLAVIKSGGARFVINGKSRNWYIRGDGGEDDLRIGLRGNSDTTDSDKVVIGTEGVGIGTDDPFSNLSVVGSTGQGYQQIKIRQSDATADQRTGIMFAESAAGTQGFGIGGFGDATKNRLFVGGGANGMDAATNIVFATAPAVGTNIGQTRMTIDATGNVGIGMTPKRSTFDLSAKEQLKEWKTKAKKASWEIVTDGAFEEEPAEELVTEWIETRAAGDRLQVNGDGYFYGTVNATGKVAGLTLEAQGQMVVSAGAVYRVNPDITNGGGGLYFNGAGVLPANPTGISDVEGLYTLGSGSRQWKHVYGKDATFSRNVGINAEPKAEQPLVVHEAGTGYGGGIESGTKNVGGNAGYKFSTADVTRWSMSLQGGADEESMRFIKHKSDGSLTKMFGVNHSGDAMVSKNLSVGGEDLTGTFENAAPSVTVGATYGAKISGSGSGIGLFGSNLVVNLADGLPVVQNTHSNYGAMGLSFGWGGMKVWRKGGAVTSGDAVDEIGKWDHEGLKVDDTVTVGGTSKVDSQELIGSYQVMYPGVAGGGSWFWSGNQQGIFYIKAGGTWDGGVEAMRLSGTGNVIFGGTVNGTRMIQDGAPVIDAKGLISTLSTLRNATKDETTLEGLRDSIGNAIGGLIEKFEAEIAAMPAPEPEIETMPASSEETE